MKTMKTMLVIGLGRFGRHLAFSLTDLDCQVMAIDKNEELVEEAAERVRGVFEQYFHFTQERIAFSINEAGYDHAGEIDGEIVPMLGGPVFLNEDEVMMQALDAGASDFSAEDKVFEVYTEPDDFDTVKEALKTAGLPILESQVEMVPQNYIKLTSEDDIKNMTKMLEVMEDNDDVQNVWHNWEE